MLRKMTGGNTEYKANLYFYETGVQCHFYVYGCLGLSIQVLRRSKFGMLSLGGKSLVLFSHFTCV